MGFSLQTVLIAILATNILIILMALIFRNTDVMIRLGYKLLSLGVILITLRLFIPFEFPFTKNINLPEAFSFTIVQILHPRLGFCSIWHVLLIIWVFGTSYRLLLFIKEHRKLMDFIAINGVNVTTNELYLRVLEEICLTKQKRNIFTIYEVSNINSPMICGILRPKILLPKGLSLAETDLRLILWHESSHYFHHDLLLKLIVQIICIIYWWNPMGRLLQKQVDTILEIRIDHELTHAEQKQKANYYSCLLNIAKHSVKETMHSPHIVYYCMNSHSILHHRMEIGLNSPPRKNLILNIFYTTLLITMYLCSHLFILEPLYVSPETEDTTVGTMSNDFYYILDESGVYHIYYLGELIETTASLEYYPGIRPYEEGDNYYEKKENH